MGRSSLDFPASVEYRLIDCRTGNSIISRRPNIIKRECPGAFLQLDRECWRGQRTRPAPPRSPWYLLGLALEALKGGTSTSTSTGCSPVSTAEPRLRVCGVHAHQFQAAAPSYNVKRIITIRVLRYPGDPGYLHHRVDDDDQSGGPRRSRWIHASSE